MKNPRPYIAAAGWRWVPELVLSGLILGLLGAPIAGSTAALGKPDAKDRRLAARQQLGRLLFFEPALSANGKRSCASCHRPEKAFCDQRAVPRALRFTANLDRNSPTLLNATSQATFFHDGRAGSIAQVLTAVLTSPQEFGSSYAEVRARLGSSPEYRRWFRRAFGPSARIEPATMAAALTAYLNTLSCLDSPYDRAQRGSVALDSAARTGALLFGNALGCARCHSGPLFRDGQRHEVRPGFWVKTPGLRNVVLTMPYGAEGGYASVAAVLASTFHRAQTPRWLTPADERRLLAFLTALTDTAGTTRSQPAALPPLSALPNRVPGGSY